MNTRAMLCQTHLGFTLVEAMVTLAILAILVTQAVPAFNQTMERQRITRAAESVLSDVRWARSEAIKRNRQVRLYFTTASPWGYLICAATSLDTFGTCSTDSTQTNRIKTVDGGNSFSATTLSSVAFDLSGTAVSYTTFEPARGTNQQPGTINITTTNYSANITVSALGRARICIPTGATAFGGYGLCS